MARGDATDHRGIFPRKTFFDGRRAIGARVARAAHAAPDELGDRPLSLRSALKRRNTPVPFSIFQLFSFDFKFSQLLPKFKILVNRYQIVKVASVSPHNKNNF